MSLLNVVCVLRSGGKVGYDATWVEKLQNAVKRNLTLPHRFVCLSDVDVPCERIQLDTQGLGYWSKLQLFKAGQFTGPTFYLDLDTLVCRNIDKLMQDLMAQNKFVMWQDPDYKLSSSAIMYWNGDYSNIYTEYMAQPEYWEHRFSQENQGTERLVGDQAVISTLTEHVFINDFGPPLLTHVVGKRDKIIDMSEVTFLIFRKVKSKPSTHLDHPLVQQHWK